MVTRRMPSWPSKTVRCIGHPAGNLSSFRQANSLKQPEPFSSQQAILVTGQDGHRPNVCCLNYPSVAPALASQSQRPPLVVPTVNIAPPTIANSQIFGTRAPFPATQVQRTHSDAQRHIAQAGSQPTDSWDMQPSSQVPFASTQVVPGPYGGRPGAPKKKPAKKRIGGF